MAGVAEERVAEAAAAAGGDAAEGPVVTDLKLAIVGKRSAGKSTLVNTLAGEPRMIVSEIAGTTRTRWTCGWSWTASR